jgi:hypothetical protein
LSLPPLVLLVYLNTCPVLFAALAGPAVCAGAVGC